MTGLVHKDDYYETPMWLFQKLESWIGGKFILDACANEKNTKCVAFISEESDALKQDWKVYAISPEQPGPFFAPTFVNPPASKNGKLVKKAIEQHEKHGMDIVILIRWNDLGNKYCDGLRQSIIDGETPYMNLGKVIFDKNGVPSQWPSRLNYLAVWLVGKHGKSNTHIN